MDNDFLGFDFSGGGMDLMPANLLETAEVVNNACSFPEKADAMIIANNDDLAQADVFFGAMRAMRKEIERVFDPLVKSAYKHYKEIKATKDDAEEPVLRAEKIVNGKVTMYMGEVKRQRNEALARQRAEEEKIRCEQEAVMAEKRAEAQKAIDEGRRMTPFIPVPILPVTKTAVPVVPVLQQGTIRTTWDFEITDAALLPREYLMPNEKAIGAVVRALKNVANIPGVRVFEVASLGAKGGRVSRSPVKGLSREA